MCPQDRVEAPGFLQVTPESVFVSESTGASAATRGKGACSWIRAVGAGTGVGGAPGPSHRAPHAPSWWGPGLPGSRLLSVTLQHDALGGSEESRFSHRSWGRWVLGARVRHSAHGKGHEEGGSTYAKAGSSLRSPPGNPRASTPITRACLPYYFVLSPTSRGSSQLRD